MVSPERGSNGLQSSGTHTRRPEIAVQCALGPHVLSPLHVRVQNGAPPSVSPRSHSRPEGQGSFAHGVPIWLPLTARRPQYSGPTGSSATHTDSIPPFCKGMGRHREKPFSHSRSLWQRERHTGLGVSTHCEKRPTQPLAGHVTLRAEAMQELVGRQTGPTWPSTHMPGSPCAVQVVPISVQATMQCRRPGAALGSSSSHWPPGPHCSS
jgi:hypothetical protein